MMCMMSIGHYSTYLCWFFQNPCLVQDNHCDCDISVYFNFVPYGEL